MLDRVIVPRRVQNCCQGSAGSELRVAHGPHDALDACMEERARAHEARLDGRVENGSGQTHRARGARGLGDREELGVRGRVVQRSASGCGRARGRSPPGRGRPRSGPRPRRRRGGPPRARAASSRRRASGRPDPWTTSLATQSPT
jgi:hypothetical protein